MIITDFFEWCHVKGLLLEGSEDYWDRSEAEAMQRRHGTWKHGGKGSLEPSHERDRGLSWLDWERDEDHPDEDIASLKRMASYGLPQGAKIIDVDSMQNDYLRRLVKMPDGELVAQNASLYDTPWYPQHVYDDDSDEPQANPLHVNPAVATEKHFDQIDWGNIPFTQLPESWRRAMRGEKTKPWYTGEWETPYHQGVGEGEAEHFVADFRDEIQKSRQALAKVNDVRNMKRRILEVKRKLEFLPPEQREKHQDIRKRFMANFGEKWERNLQQGEEAVAALDEQIGAVESSMLIFADWLEERGDPMADMIRQGIEVVRKNALRPSAVRYEDQAPYEGKWEIQFIRLKALEKFGANITLQQDDAAP
jgi:hypothetical protein